MLDNFDQELTFAKTENISNSPSASRKEISPPFKRSRINRHVKLTRSCKKRERDALEAIPRESGWFSGKGGHRRFHSDRKPRVVEPRELGYINRSLSRSNPAVGKPFSCRAGD